MKAIKWLGWLGFSLAFALGPAVAEAQDGSGQPPGNSAVNSEALRTLKLMAETLAQAPGFGVTVGASYDVMQESGQRIEFGERRKVAVRRPDRLRVEVQESDGKRSLVTYDGQAITVFDPDENAYGQIEKAGGVDEAVRYLVQNLGMRMPLALMMVTTLPTELESRIQSIDYVERDALTSVPTDHIAGRAADVDFEVWTTVGDRPLPQRLTITYKYETGMPQYRTEFSDWNLDPGLSQEDVAFHPPPGAERIPLFVRVRRPLAAPPETAGEPPAAPDNGGGAK